MVHWSLSRRTDGRGPLPSGVWGKGLPAVAHPTAINNRFFLDAEDGCHAQVYSSIKGSLAGRKRRAEWKLLSDAQFLHFEASKLSWFYILPSSGSGSTLLFGFFLQKGKQCRVVRRGEKEEAPPEDGRTDRRSGRSAIHPNLVTNWRGKGGEILRVQKTRRRGQRKPSKKPSLSSSSLFFSSRAQKTGAFLFIPSLSLPRSRE